MQSPLIDALALETHLGDAAWVAVDCRFNLLDPAAGRAAYARGHIPGARYADLDRDLARAPAPHEGRHPLPAAADLAARFGAWGIDNRTTVVAYDDGSGAIAARLWWLARWLGAHRSFVLNGGLAAWVEAGLPVEIHEPRVQPATFVPREPPPGAVLETSEIEAWQRAGGLLVDARAEPRYRGEQEPIDPVAGHVPGARNRPFSANVAATTGRFKPERELRRELEALLEGRRPDQIAAMCGSGVTACQLLLALEAAGLPGAKLYAGSWSEWIRDPARPVRTGSDA